MVVSSRIISQAIDGVGQDLQKSFRLTRHPRFPHDVARIIHNADARLLDRNVQSSKMVHAALLLLMLEAVFSRTSFHHQPEAQHPKSSAIHKLPADYPIFRADQICWFEFFAS
jgi:hypothetical protein